MEQENRMKFNEAKEILENEGYLITENYYGSVIEKHTVADEQEQDTYHGRLDGFWWSITAGFAMSKSDRSGKSKQYKVYAGKLGEPKTRKCLATKANYSNVFDIIADYLNKLNGLKEDFTQGVGAPLGADQGIPHSMQGCAVPMMRLGEPAPYGKIQKCGPSHPMDRHKPIPFGSNVNLQNGKKRKSKKKKRNRG